MLTLQYAGEWCRTNLLLDRNSIRKGNGVTSPSRCSTSLSPFPAAPSIDRGSLGSVACGRLDPACSLLRRITALSILRWARLIASRMCCALLPPQRYRRSLNTQYVTYQRPLHPNSMISMLRKPLCLARSWFQCKQRKVEIGSCCSQGSDFDSARRS
jgi:hypothetical protein